METQNQPAPIGATPAPSKAPVWIWVLGGCLGIVLLGMLVVGGLVWWGAKKVKHELKEAQPKLEEWGKDAQKMQEQAQEWQKEMEKLQKQIPAPSDIPVE